MCERAAACASFSQKTAVFLFFFLTPTCADNQQYCNPLPRHLPFDPADVRHRSPKGSVREGGQGRARIAHENETESKRMSKGLVWI